MVAKGRNFLGTIQLPEEILGENIWKIISLSSAILNIKLYISTRKDLCLCTKDEKQMENYVFVAEAFCSDNFWTCGFKCSLLLHDLQKERSIIQILAEVNKIQGSSHKLIFINQQWLRVEICAAFTDVCFIFG